MHTSVSFRLRVAREMEKARRGRGSGFTGHLSFTHNEVNDIFKDLQDLYAIENNGKEMPLEDRANDDVLRASKQEPEKHTDIS